MIHCTSVRPLGSREKLSQCVFAGLWLLVFSLPFKNLLQVSVLGSVNQLLGAATVLGALLAVGQPQRLRPPLLSHLLMATLPVWAGVTYAWSIEPSVTISHTFGYLQLLSMVWLIWQFAETKDRQKLLLVAYVLSSYVVALLTIGRYLQGEPVVEDEGRVHHDRFAGVANSPNMVGQILALSIPMAVYLNVTEQDKRWRWLYRLHLFFAGWATLLTASRGSFISGSVTLAFPLLAYWSLSQRRRLQEYRWMVAQILLMSILIPQASAFRLGTTVRELRGGTLNSRRIIWEAGLRAYRDRPVLGSGAGTFKVAISPHFDPPHRAHNTWVSLLVSQGPVGVLLFGTVVAALLAQIRRFPWLDRLLWITLLVAWFLISCVSTWDRRLFTWLLFGLAAAWAGATNPVLRGGVGSPKEEAA